MFGPLLELALLAVVLVVVWRVTHALNIVLRLLVMVITALASLAIMWSLLGASILNHS